MGRGRDDPDASDEDGDSEQERAEADEAESLAQDARRGERAASEERRRVRGDHAEVADEQVKRPLVILGLPRTGTSLASYLLDQDPHRRSLLTWEAEDSVPPSTPDTLRTDPRCHDCLMHSGFEASVVRKLGESPRDMWTMAKWNFLS